MSDGDVCFPIEQLSGYEHGMHDDRELARHGTAGRLKPIFSCSLIPQVRR